MGNFELDICTDEHRRISEAAPDFDDFLDHSMKTLGEQVAERYAWQILR